MPHSDRTIPRPKSQAASPTGVNSSHGEAVRPTKLAWVSAATGSHQVLPRGLARKCPVDIFAEAAISKEYLSAEGSSRASAWASLGVLSTKTLSSHGLPFLHGCGRRCPTQVIFA